MTIKEFTTQKPPEPVIEDRRPIGPQILQQVQDRYPTLWEHVMTRFYIPKIFIVKTNNNLTTWEAANRLSAESTNSFDRNFFTATAYFLEK